MESTTATGYWRYMALFEKEMNESKAEHFYFAEICSELACIPYLVWGKEPPKEFRDLKTFMLKFGDPEEIARKSEELALRRAERDQQLSSSVWCAALGIPVDENGNPVVDKNKKKETGNPTTRTFPPHVKFADEAGNAPSVANASTSGVQATFPGSMPNDAVNATPGAINRAPGGLTVVINGGNSPDGH